MRARNTRNPFPEKQPLKNSMPFEVLVCQETSCFEEAFLDNDDNLKQTVVQRVSWKNSNS